MTDEPIADATYTITTKWTWKISQAKMACNGKLTREIGAVVKALNKRLGEPENTSPRVYVSEQMLFEDLRVGKPMSAEDRAILRRHR
jgi:hypothetical protein